MQGLEGQRLPAPGDQAQLCIGWKAWPFHWVLKRSPKNWTTAAKDKWGRVSCQEGPFTPTPTYLPGPKMQALRNLGLGRPPEEPGLELA